MDDQLRLDRQLTEFFSEAKAISLTPDEREQSRFAIESFLMAHSVSLVPEGRLQKGMEQGTRSSASPQLFLGEEERRQVRNNLIEFMQQNPRYVPEAEIETSPVSLYRIFELAFPRFALGVLLFVGIGAGVTYASQASVPGDFLYPFKVSVYEPFVSKIATSDTSQAAWEARRAQNRLKEAAKLAAEAKLTKEAADELRMQFEEHLARTQRNIDVLNSSGKTDVALSIQTELESYLDSNSSIVREIAADGDPRVGVAAAAKIGASSSDANGKAGHHSSNGHSLTQKVMTILSLPPSSVSSGHDVASSASSATGDAKASSSLSEESAKSSSAVSSKHEEQSSSKEGGQSSVAQQTSSQAAVDVDVEVSSEADDLVPQVFHDIMESTSSAVPPLPQLLR